ncbi:two-component system histidine kinase PnpS [Edaphobacillus lindanitolerans]|uniref:histidine kinase n=1 Tax=Edaphobacillus lindanitolerans TaxID=550447 RepID=A0A1U7PQX9_9BACI|nr:ATP-binding protein [Edaphobacillus lindanitolerans]SIT84928.1 two-component system, OmpR family, phosphate regulon sensor histidine kinase PhoR [Edaphobacillus lindanitolerans]
MKPLRKKLLVSFLLIMCLTLAGVLFVLAQLLPVYLSHEDERAAGEVSGLLQDKGIILDEPTRNELEERIAGIDAETGKKQLPIGFLSTLLITFSAAFIVSAVLYFRLTDRYVHPIDLVTGTALELAKGNYRARAEWSAPGMQSALVTAVNALARNLQDMEALRETEAERLETLIGHMGSGLLMIGHNSEIAMANSFFLNQLNLEEHALIGKSYKAAALPSGLIRLIDAVQIEEKPRTEQMDIETGNSTGTMAVYAAPVIGGHGSWLGIVVVMHDITELIRLERVRKDFVANVSHELRTPVTSIKGFSETLLDGAINDPEATGQFLEIIHRESGRLETLIEDLLDLSRIEKEGFTLELAGVRVQNILNQAAGTVSGRLEERGMKLSMDCPEHLAVMGDEPRLVQVFVNLLANAIAYSRPGTDIRITADSRGDMAEISVEDHGIGIPEEEIPRLFERFYRVDRARSRDSGGTGLGLAIVKHLVELHGGSIGVESKLGEGSVFTIRIPLARQTGQ